MRANICWQSWNAEATSQRVSWSQTPNDTLKCLVAGKNWWMANPGWEKLELKPCGAQDEWYEWYEWVGVEWVGATGFAILFLGRIRLGFFFSLILCEISPFGQMLMEGIRQRFCPERPHLQFLTISVVPSLRNLFLGTSGQRSTLVLWSSKKRTIRTEDVTASPSEFCGLKAVTWQ